MQVLKQHLRGATQKCELLRNELECKEKFIEKNLGNTAMLKQMNERMENQCEEINGLKENLNYAAAALKEERQERALRRELSENDMDWKLNKHFENMTKLVENRFSHPDKIYLTPSARPDESIFPIYTTPETKGERIETEFNSIEGYDSIVHRTEQSDLVTFAPNETYTVPNETDGSVEDRDIGKLESEIRELQTFNKYYIQMSTDLIEEKSEKTKDNEKMKIIMGGLQDEIDNLKPLTQKNINMEEQLTIKNKDIEDLSIELNNEKSKKREMSERNVVNEAMIEELREKLYLYEERSEEGNDKRGEFEDMKDHLESEIKGLEVDLRRKDNIIEKKEEELEKEIRSNSEYSKKLREEIGHISKIKEKQYEDLRIQKREIENLILEADNNKEVNNNRRIEKELCRENENKELEELIELRDKERKRAIICAGEMEREIHILREELGDIRGKWGKELESRCKTQIHLDTQIANNRNSMIHIQEYILQIDSLTQIKCEGWGV